MTAQPNIAPTRIARVSLVVAAPEPVAEGVGTPR